MDEFSYDPILIGKRIKAFRKKHGITQEVLAEILSVSIDSVSKYENGKVAFGNDYMLKLCKMYNVSADYFLFNMDKPLYDAPKDSDMKIANLLESCNEFDKERAYQIIKIMLNKNPAA